MAPVILTGTDTVELVVIQPYQLFPSCGITPYPILKALLDKLLLRLGDSRFLFIGVRVFSIKTSSDIRQPKEREGNVPQRLSLIHIFIQEILEDCHRLAKARESGLVDQ